MNARNRSSNRSLRSNMIWRKFQRTKIMRLVRPKTQMKSSKRSRSSLQLLKPTCKTWRSLVWCRGLNQSHSRAPRPSGKKALLRRWLLPRLQGGPKFEWQRLSQRSHQCVHLTSSSKWSVHLDQLQTWSRCHLKLMMKTTIVPLLTNKNNLLLLARITMMMSLTLLRRSFSYKLQRRLLHKRDLQVNPKLTMKVNNSKLSNPCPSTKKKSSWKRKVMMSQKL